MPKRLRIVKERKKIPKKWIVALGVCTALALWGAVWWYDSATPRQAHTVHVTIAGEQGQPLADAPVAGLIDTARLPASEWRGLAAVTDAQGVCTFENVLSGSYWLRAGGGICAVDVPSTAARGLRLAVSPVDGGMTVTLRVAGADGKPAVGLPVDERAFGLEDGAAPVSGGGETDWQGVYVWKNAPAGAHILNIGGVETPLVVEPGENHAISANITWYPAKPVSMRLRFQNSGGAPLAGEKVARVVYGLPGGKEILLEEYVTGPDGALAFSADAPGEYTLRVRGRRFKLAIGPEGGPDTGTFTL